MHRSYSFRSNHNAKFWICRCILPRLARCPCDRLLFGVMSWSRCHKKKACDACSLTNHLHHEQAGRKQTQEQNEKCQHHNKVSDHPRTEVFSHHDLAYKDIYAGRSEELGINFRSAYLHRTPCWLVQLPRTQLTPVSAVTSESMQPRLAWFDPAQTRAAN